MLEDQLSTLEILEQWKAFALSLWGVMDHCDKDEECTKQFPDQMCPCDYYKKLVLNK